MLTLAVAASAFAACNKQETTPVVNDNMGNKSIVMNIANLVATKTADTQVGATKVALNNYQVFFSDGSTLYQPKNSTAENFTEAQKFGTYFEDSADTTRQFHFLDNNVTKVIVVGNLPEVIKPTEVTTETALRAKINALLAVDDQQTVTNLVLYGVDASLERLTNKDDHESTEDQHPSPVYKAEVNLMPTVARFEVIGYQYNEGEDAQYDTVMVNNQSLIHYYKKATVNNEWTVVPSEIDELVIYNENNVYQNYFIGLDAKGEWYYDDVNVALVPSNEATAAAPSETQNCYAYHVYPTEVPSFIFQLTGTDAYGIVTPLYLQTRGFEEIEEIEAGNIYQMTVVFDDSNLAAAEKCIDVKITVHKWVVTVVTPEF